MLKKSSSSVVLAQSRTQRELSIKQGFYIGKCENAALILEQNQMENKSMREEKKKKSWGRKNKSGFLLVFP